MGEPLFFETRAAFREWLAQHHASEPEVVLRFYKKGTGKGGPFTYEEAILESLCFGWIDGVRRSLDAESYGQRFTPRTRSSNWSRININRFQELQAQGLVTPAGLAAFEARTDANSGVYSFEQGDVALDKAQTDQFKLDSKAWEYWQKAPAGYRKTAAWWVISAKRPETRAKRLEELIACSAQGLKIPMLRR